jgi:hypothetical protein
MHGISHGGIVRSQSGTASEQKTIIPALRGRIPIAGPHRRITKKSGRLGRRIKSSALKYVDRTPINQNNTDSTRSLRSADLAFQHAMRRAVAQGLEHPPMIGVAKDNRPLSAPRLFDPVPDSSGCTSPALVCAELMADDDCPPAAPKLQSTSTPYDPKGSDLYRRQRRP